MSKNEVYAIAIVGLVALVGLASSFNEVNSLSGADGAEIIPNTPFAPPPSQRGPEGPKFILPQSPGTVTASCSECANTASSLNHYNWEAFDHEKELWAALERVNETEQTIKARRKNLEKVRDDQLRAQNAYNMCICPPKDSAAPNIPR